MESRQAKCDAAGAALEAVHQLLPVVVVIPEIADAAEIPRELGFAAQVFANSLWVLDCVAIHAFDLFYRMPIHFVILSRVGLVMVVNLIVAGSTRVKVFANFTLDLATSSIMFAPKQLRQVFYRKVFAEDVLDEVERLLPFVQQLLVLHRLGNVIELFCAQKFPAEIFFNSCDRWKQIFLRPLNLSAYNLALNEDHLRHVS